MIDEPLTVLPEARLIAKLWEREARENGSIPASALVLVPAQQSTRILMHALNLMPAVDREYRLVRCNPTWAAFIERYTPSRASQVVPGAHLFDCPPRGRRPKHSRCVWVRAG